MVLGTNNPFSFREFSMGENSQVTMSNLVAAIKASLGLLLFNHDTLTTSNTLFRTTDEQRHTLYNSFTWKLFTKATTLKLAACKQHSVFVTEDQMCCATSDWAPCDVFLPSDGWFQNPEDFKIKYCLLIRALPSTHLCSSTNSTARRLLPLFYGESAKPLLTSRDAVAACYLHQPLTTEHAFTNSQLFLLSSSFPATKIHLPKCECTTWEKDS